jgi:hypothetical protein
VSEGAAYPLEHGAPVYRAGVLRWFQKEKVKTRILENHKDAAPKIVPPLVLSATRQWEKREEWPTLYKLRKGKATPEVFWVCHPPRVPDGC